MSKQEWKSIEFEVIKFNVEDVIATSPTIEVIGEDPAGDC